MVSIIGEVELLARLLQCSTSLQTSVLPEAAEILQILQKIEFEGLFFSHDKLAERQVKREDCGPFHSLSAIPFFCYLPWVFGKQAPAPSLFLAKAQSANI